MRFAIDATAPVVGGGLTYMRELVPRLCSAAPEDQFWLFLRARSAPDDLVLPANCRVVDVRVPRRGTVAWRVAWQQARLPGALRRIQADALLAPYDLAPCRAPCRVVLGIQNAGPYADPPARTLGQRGRERLLRFATGLGARRAAHVYFVSEWSRQVISRALRLPPHRTRVIHNGVSPRFFDPAPPAPDRWDALTPYVLVVGSVNPRKDHLTLARAWKTFVERTGWRYRLLIVGPVIDQVYFECLAAEFRRLGLNEFVTFIAGVPQEGMPGLYRRAAALVLPTMVETFGLPMVEAMASGTPVLASDIPITQEIGGPAAAYYKLGDPHSLAGALECLVMDPRAAERAREAGRTRARQFSWEEAARRVLSLLREGT